RSGAPQGFQKCLIVGHCAGKFGCQFRQGLAVCLAHIEHLDRAEHGDFDFFSSMTALPSASRIGAWVSGSLFISSIFFLYGVGAMMVMPCSPFFTWRPNWFFHLLYPATRVASGRCI